ncbi:MAG: hypothetical protein WC451_05845 [Patescibacteria group bacterium]|jgi:hypothetical protein
MARPKKKTKDADLPRVETVTEPEVTIPVPALSYALKRELEEIQRNTGQVIDLFQPVEELEKICNKANNPPASWRDRWNG